MACEGTSGRRAGPAGLADAVIAAGVALLGLASGLGAGATGGYAAAVAGFPTGA
jgi:hypothetical protein